MAKVYKTANGKQINMDALIASNEQSIAVGNMGVNARGDQLGPGGVVEKTKDQVMKDYYKLNTPVAQDNPPQPRQNTATKKELVDDWVEPVQEEAPSEPEQPDQEETQTETTEEQPQTDTSDQSSSNDDEDNNR